MVVHGILHLGLRLEPKLHGSVLVDFSLDFQTVFLAPRRVVNLTGEPGETEEITIGKELPSRGWGALQAKIIAFFTLMATGLAKSTAEKTMVTLVVVAVQQAEVDISSRFHGHADQPGKSPIVTACELSEKHGLLA